MGWGDLCDTRTHTGYRSRDAAAATLMRCTRDRRPPPPRPLIYSRRAVWTAAKVATTRGEENESPAVPKNNRYAASIAHKSREPVVPCENRFFSVMRALLKYLKNIYKRVKNDET